MTWLYLALFSNFLLAVVFVLDKILVKKVFSPLNYALVIGGLSGLALFLLPLVDFAGLNPTILAAAILSGVFSIGGIYFYFKVLSEHEISWVIPLLFGVSIPIITFILSRFFLGEILSSVQIFAFGTLLGGGFILSLSRQYKFYSILMLLIAGIFLSLELVFLKFVFNHVNFISGYVLSRLGGFSAGLALFFAFYRKKISELHFRRSYSNRGIGLVIFKQFLSFIGNLTLVLAISLGNLTLINGIRGARYPFVFLLALFLAKKWPNIMDEPLSFWPILRKSTAILLIIFGVLILLIQPAQTPGAKIWGVDFSDLYSKQVGLNSREVLPAILNDLKVKNFRLNAHWSEIEKNEGQYDFSELDFQISEIKKSGGKIILALGKRLPRWPECHEPNWTKQLTTNNQQQSLLKYVETTVNRYKDNPAVWAWQVENEPFLWGFGECPKVDDELLDEEIALVKNLDNTRPIILTDSGEFGLWHRAYKRSDIFGTTMYRVVHSRLFGDNFKYPLGPDFFKTKVAIMESLFAKKEIINIELQAEPWLSKRPPDVPLEEQLKAFDINQFKENIEYARQVGFEKNYLWGIEWIYWMKKEQNHPEFWNYAKELFKI